MPSNCRNARFDTKFAHVGELFPPIISQITVSEQIISQVSEWYNMRNEARPELVHRSTVAAQFINYGTNADIDVDRFIHLFIALDALFGSRGQVEKGIIFGLKETFSKDGTWVNRADKLFKLRNELLHGGSSNISDWAQLAAYETSFKATPLDDVREAALVALSKYLKLPAYEEQKLPWYWRIIKWIKDFPLVR